MGKSKSQYSYNDEAHKREFGGYLYDREDYAYWMKPDQYSTAKDFDLSCEDSSDGDAKYFDWFDDFVESEHIRKEPWKRYVAGGQSVSSYWTKSSKTYEDDDDWMGGHNYYIPTGKYGGVGNTQSIELAMAVQAAQSVVDVINDEENLVVSLISSQDEHSDELSYTIFEHNIIKISPQPFIKEKEIGLDLFTGLALHEGSHGKWTDSIIRNIDGRVCRDPKISKKIGHFLSNMLEDVRIERNLVKEYPGFAEYLRIMHDWVWGVYNEPTAPEKYETLIDRMKTALYAVRYPKKTGILSDPSFDGEIEWWKDWAKKYKGAQNLEELMREGHEHLLNGDELPPEDQIQEIPGACGSGNPGDKSTLSEEAVQAITKMTQEEAELLSNGQQGGGGYGPVVLRRPLETDLTKKMTIRNDPLIARMREALIFRQAKPMRESNLLEDGDLDDEELHRISVKDLRVFKATSVTEDIPEVAVTLLVDASSSMGGYYWGQNDRNDPMSAAHRCATILVEALKKIKGAVPQVIAYTTSNSGFDITRIWEPGDPMSRLGILKAGLEMGGTPTGTAIKYVGEKINRDFSEKDRILIVISDGYPDDQNNVKKEVDELRKTGVRVMQVSVSASVDQRSQAHMYGPEGFIPLKPGESPSSIIRPLTRWLKKFVS